MNIFLPEKTNETILEDISYNNNFTIIIISIYFSESMKDGDVNVFDNHHSSLQFVLLKFDIDIFDSLKTKHFSAT